MAKLVATAVVLLNALPADFRFDKSRRSDRTPLIDNTFGAGLNCTF